MIKTFKGGVHPPHNKFYTEKKPTEVAKLPKKVIIPLSQHIGAPCEPIVKVGDLVKKGQKIGDSDADWSAPIHASTSGKVVAIESRHHPEKGMAMSIVIDADGKDEVFEEIKPPKPLEQLTSDEIKKIVREAGIVGMGGAAFPSHLKLTPPEGRDVEAILLNGSECEPYVTSDHRLMVERPGDIIFGLDVIMKATGVNKGIIGIEDNKPDAIKSMNEAIKDRDDIKVVIVATKYPQGDKKQLIYAVTGKEVPKGGRSADAGVIIYNVGTAAAIADTIKTGMPFVERIVTVTGSGIKEPKNLIARMGTPFSELIEQCGGFKGEPGKIVMGGPMMGPAQYVIDVPVLKATFGILVFEKSEVKVFNRTKCIKCARCVEACPMRLLPVTISKFAEKKMWTEAEQYNAADCIECGSCGYVCPAHIPLTQLMRIARFQVKAIKKSRRKKK